MKINKHTFAWILFSALFLSSCTSLNKLEQPVLTDYVLLKNNQILGQTFVSDYDGFKSIILYLKPEANSEGILTIHLRENPQDTKELRTASLSLHDVDSQGGYEFSFQPIGDSNTLNYFVDLELEGEDSKIWVGVAPGGSYINGALYSQGIPQDLQLAFQLTFSPLQALLGLVTEALTWIGWLAATVFLFVPPGWVLLMLLWRGWDQIGWIEKFCLAMGTGLAFYPILLIFTHQIAFNLGSLYAWLFPVISIVIIAWHYLRTRSLQKLFDSLRWDSLTKSPHLWTNLTFLLIVGLIFGVRFWNIRAIEIPMWGDSYQHTMIAQLIIDNGGLFSSWEPYVPYHSLSVHFGFPFSVALFSWVTNLPVTSATLIFGQIINGLAALLLFPWTLRISKNNYWAACSTVLIAGLITQIPAIYVNWGRYAQLSGQVILPVAFLLTWSALESQVTLNNGSAGEQSFIKSILTFTWSKLFVVGLVIAGMMLYYYRMPIFFAALVAAWLIGWGLPTLRVDLRKWVILFMSLILCGGISILLILPWLRNLISVKTILLTIFRPPVDTVLSSIQLDYSAWLDVTRYIPGLIVVASLIALFISLIQKKWVVASLGLWVFFLSLIVAGRLIHLPGTSAIQNFAIVIMLYIPASILSGWLVGESTKPITKKLNITGNIFASVCLLTLAVWGGAVVRSIANPNLFALVNRPDLHAMSWINEYTPKDSRFLVEGFRIYGGASAVGSDAGWWISLLADRQNTMPPQYALLNEIPLPSDYSHRVVEIVALLENNSPGSLQSIRMICEERITHAYIGQSQGTVGGGVTQLYSPEDFQNSPYWKIVYHQDRVYIYELDPDICQTFN